MGKHHLAAAAALTLAAAVAVPSPASAAGLKATKCSTKGHAGEDVTLCSTIAWQQQIDGPGEAVTGFGSKCTSGVGWILDDRTTFNRVFAKSTLGPERGGWTGPCSGKFVSFGTKPLGETFNDNRTFITQVEVELLLDFWCMTTTWNLTDSGWTASSSWKEVPCA